MSENKNVTVPEGCATIFAPREYASDYRTLKDNIQVSRPNSL